MTTTTATVEAIARFCIAHLRSRGLSDQEIFTGFTQPIPELDVEFERQQIIESGIVTMPAIDVKDAMRRMLVN